MVSFVVSLIDIPPVEKMAAAGDGHSAPLAAANARVTQYLCVRAFSVNQF